MELKFNSRVTDIIGEGDINMSLIWTAPVDVVTLLNDVKQKHHFRISNAQVALAFSDVKAFKNNRFNFGTTGRFSKLNKLWQGIKYDFVITLSFDSWSDVLDNNQREALLDLHLTRCSVKYLPAVNVVNGKEIPIKDEHGRIQYTDQPKLSDDGDPEYIVLPLDLSVFSQNIRRYGLWLEDISEIKTSIEAHEDV